MKLSDYVATFLAQLGIRHAFVVQGGAIAHVVGSIAKTPGIDYVCVSHEQAGAIAVHGYSTLPDEGDLAYRQRKLRQKSGAYGS